MAHGDGWSDIDDLLNPDPTEENNNEEDTNMSGRLVWDQEGQRLYETGVDQGVIYPMGDNGYRNGVAWNGLTAVNESPSGAEATALWADNIKYLNLYSAEEFGATIESYTYPDEFAECNGEAELMPGVRIGQQERKKFAFSYRTKVGNDVKGNDYGYKIHIVYGAQASPSETANSTVNDSPEAITFSHELTTTPVNVEGFKPTAHLEIDSTKFTAEAMKALEDYLYGTASTDAQCPMPDKVVELLGGSLETENSEQANG